MRILYVINTGQVGGMQRHVLCLMRALKGVGVAETAVVLNTELDSEIVLMFENKGCKVYRLCGRSGHDWRIVCRFHQILKEFQPDVIHAHGIPLFLLIYLAIWKRSISLLQSIHQPTQKPSFVERVLDFLFAWRINLWLPVSSPTWQQFVKWYPKARGEIFFNPLYLADFERDDIADFTKPRNGKRWVIGMVGRNADQKDWPSFHRVEQLVKAQLSDVDFLNAGEEAVCDGRAAMRQMDLFIMTSKHEQLPTTVLECFALGTPICGFVPDGGTTDILAFSNGAVANAFIHSRSCEQLAQVLIDLINTPTKRQALVEDGRQILENHFAAEKLVPNQLMAIYRSMS